MSTSDKIHIKDHPNLSGWHDVNINNIGASYQLEANRLSVIDDGDVSGLDDLDIMTEAPIHHDILNGEYTEVLIIQGTTLRFNNNVISEF